MALREITASPLPLHLVTLLGLLHAMAPPSRTGEAVGVRSTITSISQTVLPLLFGGLGSALGMMPVFWTVAGVLGAGGACAVSQRAPAR